MMEDELKYSSHLPDNIIDAIAFAASQNLSAIFSRNVEEYGSGLSPVPKNGSTPIIENPKLSWQESCDLVISAFSAFDPLLGEMARQVLGDASRIQKKDVQAGKSSGWHQGFIAEKFHKPAPMHFDRDGTINDVIYLAHELGHLFASDASLKNKDTSGGTLKKIHTAETQAFFTQMIMYDYLFNHASGTLKIAAHQHYGAEIIQKLYELPVFLAAQQCNKDSSTDIPKLFTQFLGEDWEAYEFASSRKNGWQQIVICVKEC